MSVDATVAGRGAPVMAILTMDDGDKGFRGNRSNFIDIIDAGKAANITVYVTTVHHLKLHTSRIIGYSYNAGSKNWDRQWFPAPTVVYNRIPQREDEWMPEVRQKIEECVGHPAVRLFNQSFFNKWTMIKWVSQSPKTRRYVPSTIKYSPDNKLMPLLAKFGFLYLKPERGKAGKGIMRIRRLPAGKLRYAINTNQKTGNSIFRYPTLAQLKEKISEAVGQEDYIIQQGIKLAHYRKRPFDLRVLVQKNSRGVWSVTGIGARLAGELSITTHVPRGGSIEDPRRLLTSNFSPQRVGRILRRVKRAALVIARQIERGSGNELGELSLDIGVDKKARLWFFEANSKPMKFDEPHIRKKSLKRLMQYCSYLSGRRPGARRHFS